MQPTQKSSSDLVQKLVQQKIESASNGNADAGLWLLNEFRQTVANNRSTRNGAPLLPNTRLDESLLDWISDCFGKILDGVEPALALGVKRSKGRPARSDNSANAQDAEICLAVLRFRRDQGSSSLMDSKRRAARAMGIGLEKVGHAWKNPIAQASAEVLYRLGKK